MKKGIFLVLFLSLLTSCNQDLTLNNDAAFQGLKDNQFWKAADANAVIVAGGSLNINAVTQSESVLLTIPLPTGLVSQKDKNSYITYFLGINEDQSADYVKNLNSIIYSYETGINNGDGEVVVTDYDGSYISGTFKFNANNTDAGSIAEPTVNFQKGVFYKVPITP